MRQGAIALVLLLVPSAGWAQLGGPGPAATPLDVTQLAEEPRSPRNDPIIALRVIERTERIGTKTRQSGIIIGEEISPNVTLGLGLFSNKPRRSGLVPDPQIDPSVRGSKKASMRLTIRF